MVSNGNSGDDMIATAAAIKSRFIASTATLLIR
jgi:hypothetical protein